MSETTDVSRLSGTAISPMAHEEKHSQYIDSPLNVSWYEHPHSIFVQPVFDNLNDQYSELVGVILANVAWDRYLANLLPEGVNGIYAVLENTCGQSFTYVIRGKKVSQQPSDSIFITFLGPDSHPFPLFDSQAHFLGEGDLHDTNYDGTRLEIPLSRFKKEEAAKVLGHCMYSFSIYSSDEFRNDTESKLPLVSGIVVLCIFITMAGTFVIYDLFVGRRNDTVVKAAMRSNAILSSLFPSNVRDRLFDTHAVEAPSPQHQKNGRLPKSRLKNYLSTGDYTERIDEDDIGATAYRSKPIADLFPETTISTYAVLFLSV